MNNNRLQSLYYWFTFLLCACAGLSAVSLIGKLYLSIFLLVCGLGIYFSSQAAADTKKKLRNIFGGILFIGLPIFFWKISLQQSPLPYLIQVFLLLIIASCYIIENSSTLSLVHFECIFITIFSACLPFVIHPRYQVSLFGFGLFLIIVLLQITQIRFSSDQQDNQFIITNVSVSRKFILSFIISLLIAGIGSMIFFVVPKYSFQLDFDLRGSSFVDFKLKPKSNLRLMLPYEGGEKELSESQVVPYVRSLFVKQEQDKNLMFFEVNKWKQPLTIREKDKEKVIDSSVKKGNDKQGLVSEGNNFSEDDEQEALLTKTLDNPNAQLKTMIKNLETKIAKDKKLYDFLSFMGTDDPTQTGQINKIAKTIKQDEQKLSRLKNDLNHNQGKIADQEQLDQQGLGNIELLAKFPGLGGNGDDKKDNNGGNDLGGQGQAEKGKGNEGIGVGEEGKGKGSDGIGEGEGKGMAGINQSGFEGVDQGKIESEQGTSQGQEGNTQFQTNDNMSGEFKNKTADGKQSDNKITDTQDNIGESKSDQQTELIESIDLADTPQNMSSKGSEFAQSSGKSEQLKDNENNSSEQEKVNEKKENSPGLGGATNSPGDNKGKSSESGDGGEKSGQGNPTESLGVGEGKGKKNGDSSGSGGKSSSQSADGSGGQGDSGANGSGGGSSSKEGKNPSSAKGEGSGGAGSEEAGAGASGGSSSSPKEMGNPAEESSKDPKISIIISYLFKFENKPLSVFREQIAVITRGNVPKKESESSAESKHNKQEKLKDQKENKQKKAEEIVIVDSEVLEKEKILDSHSNFFWYMFVFFAVLFCGGICWFLLGIVFGIIRKIFRDLKLVYFFMFKLNKIIAYLYRNFLFLLKKIGLKSHEFLTPKEIGDIAVKEYNLSRSAIDSITEIFEQARYSNHQIREEDIIACIKAYNQLKIDMIKDHTLLKKIGLKLDMLSIKNRRKS